MSETRKAELPRGAAELTPRVLALGLLLSVVLGAANVYVGLKVGMTVSASIPAAVVATLIFKNLLRSSSILEANQVQTAASAGESLAAGIIFTMPALLFIGFWDRFDFWTVTAISFAGGLLGILFMIPMRRVFVADNPELPYPEGIACAAVLEASEAGSDRASGRWLVAGGVVGALFKLGVSFFGVLRGSLETAGELGRRIFYYGSELSPMLVGVGLIVRLNVALLIFAGGALGWLIGIPLIGMPNTGWFDPGASSLDQAWEVWSNQVRYVGVGAMVVGGAASILAVREGLAAAIREIRGAGRSRGLGEDLSGSVILGLGLICLLVAGWVYQEFTGSVGISLGLMAVMTVLAFFFTAVASYIVGLVGNTNSPVSGMTITAVLFTGALMRVLGYGGPSGVAAILGVAAIICCVACTSGDVCNDLKTGAIVGATPRRQQIMQVLGVAAAAAVMAPVLNLLHENVEGGIGGKELAAPQARLFQALAEALVGEGSLPWDMVGIGAGLGLVVLLLDTQLKRRGAGFRLYLMPMAVGLYLPFGIATPILLGGIIAHLATRGAKGEGERDSALHLGVLFASGTIAGEALTGVLLAGLFAAGVSKLTGLVPDSISLLATFAAAIGVLWLYLRAAPRRRG